MALVWTSQARKWSSQRNSRTLSYLVNGQNHDFGTTDPLEAVETDALTSTPTTQKTTLVRTDISVTELGNNIFQVVVTYGPSSSKSPDAPTSGTTIDFSMEIGTEQTHITQSKSTTAYPTGAAPDLGGAIGVNGRAIDGVDILTPTLQRSFTYYFAPSSITNILIGKWFAAVGTVNNDSFYGGAAGEVLCTGISGSWRDDEDQAAITFRFAYSPNETGLSVGSLTGIAKNGWQHLWVQYEEVEDATVDKLVPRPKYAFVETVYDSTDFAELGIGVSR